MATSLVSTGVQFPDNSIQISRSSLDVSGTVMMFRQTSAPTGWTKNTSTNNNSALRVVTGTVSSGGSVDFSTAFASKPVTGSISGSVSISGGSVGNHTLSIPQIPSHTHFIGMQPGPPFYGPQSLGGNNASFNPANSGATGGGGAHNHPFSGQSASFSGSFSGTAINLAVKFVDIIQATKN